MRWLNKPRALVAIAILFLLGCYASALRGMFDQWMTDEDMSHGAIVPLVILWIVWRERERWLRLPLQPSPWGFALLLSGAPLHLAGALGVGLFASSVALLISAAGVVVCLGGFALLRSWAFPFLLALFMLPKLAIVYNQVTLPLQLLASKLAAAILTTSGVGVIREGNILDVHGHRVAVAEACDGIRFLLPLGFVALLFAYLADAKSWMRVAILAAAIPLAILSNAFRVAASAWAPALDSGTPHQVLGWVVFTLTLGMLLPLPALLRKTGTFLLAADAPVPAVDQTSVQTPMWPSGALATDLQPGAAHSALAHRLPAFALLVPAFLAVQTALTYAAATGERPPSPPQFLRFPQKLGNWIKTADDPVSPDTQAVLRADSTLGLIYADPSEGWQGSLFVAWFQSQRGGSSQPHSPQVCLPAAGWTPIVADRVAMETDGGKLPINRYIATFGPQRVVVLYWYQTRSRVLASEWAAKFWVIADRLKEQRTDTSLVRVVVWNTGRSDEATTTAALGLAQEAYPILSRLFAR